MVRRYLFKRVIKCLFLCLFSFILEWGLTWLAPFLVVFDTLIDLLLSFMEGFPLSVGSGCSDAGPSRRPFDLNQPPAQEPELDLNQPPAESEQLQEARKELKVWEERLKAWHDEERWATDRRYQRLLIWREIGLLKWRALFLEIKRQGLIRAISERRESGD
jgi:hypothetical protein